MFAARVDARATMPRRRARSPTAWHAWGSSRAGADVTPQGPDAHGAAEASGSGVRWALTANTPSTPASARASAATLASAASRTA